MNTHLSEESKCFVRSLVQSGRYASEEEILEEALRLLEQREQALLPTDKKPMTEDKFERHLVAIGTMSRGPPPPDPDRPERDFGPVVIEGEPLSETIIRERR
jgi:putative addiction module CopG family antidote